MSVRNPFRVADYVARRVDNREVGLVLDVTDSQCRVAWYDRVKGTHNASVWVGHRELTLSHL